MAINSGQIESRSLREDISSGPLPADKNVPSLGSSLAKYALLFGLNKITFGKLSCVRNALNQASENLLKIGANMLQDRLAESGISQQLQSMLEPIPEMVRGKLSSLRCKANPEGLKDNFTNALKTASGVDKAAQLMDKMVSTGIDLLTKAEPGKSPDVLNRLLFMGGVLSYGNEDIKQVFDNIKSAALEKLFSPQFIKVLLKGSSSIEKFSGLVNFIVARFGVQNLADQFLTKHLLSHPRLDMSRMELHDTHEILIAKGMQMFFHLDGPNWEKEKVDAVFDSLVSNDVYAEKFKERFESISHLYDESKLAKTATNVAGFVLHDIVKPMGLNLSSNISQMTPEEFCELYQHPDQITTTQVAGLLLGNDLDSANQVRQNFDSFLQTINDVSNAINTASENVHSVVNSGMEFITDKMNEIKEIALNAITEQTLSIKRIVVDTTQSVSNIAKAIVSSISSIGEKAKEKVIQVKRSMVDAVINAGQKAVKIVKDGIKSAKSAVDFNIDISDAFDDADDLEELFGNGNPREVPPSQPQNSAQSNAPTNKPISPENPVNITPGIPPSNTISDVEAPRVTMTVEELSQHFRRWDRSQVIDMQNHLNGAEVHDDNPIRDSGYTWTATFPLSENVRAAISANNLNINFEGRPMAVNEEDRIKSTVTQLHAYAVDNSTVDDATNVVTQFFKLLDPENLRLFLPEGLREQAANADLRVSVNVTQKHPLTFDVEAEFPIGGHGVKVHFNADIKETIKRGWVYGSTITGNFASRSSTDPEKDSLRHIRYSIDDGEAFRVFG